MLASFISYYHFLFERPDLEIKVGSILSVSFHNGNKCHFQNSFYSTLFVDISTCEISFIHKKYLYRYINITNYNGTYCVFYKTFVIITSLMSESNMGSPNTTFYFSEFFTAYNQ